MGLLKKGGKKPLRMKGGSTGSSSGGGVTKTPFRPFHDPKTPPCTLGCPNNNRIRKMLTTIARTEDLGGDYHASYQEAFNIFAETTPFPSVCGRVCPHPCESDCNRQYKDKPLAINNTERFIGDYALEHNFPVKKYTDEVQSQKIAVIGSGPAGMSCAYQLARHGYQVKVFEAFSKTGGMLRYGIPDYRLPPEILDKEIERIAGLGVEISCNTIIGKDIPYEDLQKDYDAIFVGIGAHKGRKLGIAGEDAPNVYTGTEFLNLVNSGRTVEVGDKVLVVGGGDTAMDAARISKRLGADVTVVYRRTRNEMPAIEDDIVGGEEENIKFEFLTAPIELETVDGKATKMKCQRMELGEPDASGRRRPVPIDEFIEIETTCIVSAISQEPEFEGMENLREGRDWVKTDNQFKTKEDKTWAGGDNLDLGTVILAIAQGRKAAEAIDRHFKGLPYKEPAELNIISKDKMVFSYYENKERVEKDELSPEERLSKIDLEISKTYTPEQANLESARCLSCGDCFDCGTCWSLCQDGVFVKPPFKTYEPYKMKLDLCIGCKKCGESCPCGYIELRDPISGDLAVLERVQ